ncbi:MAG: tetratricopeptide repeat protein [Gemmatimonadetes bacterium]|nr:MAG: tetratricopeptide repeat protein [Gemmatimonadota bacterium]
MRKKIVVVWLCLFGLMGTRPVPAVEDLPVGARAIGLGEAFVALADDANGIQWNPASSATLNRYELTTTYTDLYGLGLPHIYLSGVLPLGQRLALGLDWSHLGYEDKALFFGEDILSVNFAYRKWEWWSLGLNVRWLQRTIDSQERLSGTGWGFDAGLLIRPSPAFQMGLTVKNIGGTRLTYNTGATEVTLSQNLKGGIAVFPHVDWIVSAEVDDRYHVGVEYRLHPLLSVRGGIQKQIDVDQDWIFSLGIGLRQAPLTFDYAYRRDPNLNDTHLFSVTTFFDRYQSPLAISVHLDDIFPVNYKRYIHHPVGYAQVQNRSTRPVILRKIRLKINGVSLDYADTPLSQILAPGEQTDLPLNALFSTALLNMTEEQIARAQLELVYKDSKPRRMTTRENVLIHTNRAIVWDDVRKVVAFVVPQSPVVAQFTRTVLDQSINVPAYLPENLFHTMRVFDAMSAQHLRYTLDPNYPEVYHRDIVDVVQRPAETLCTQSGDCDDLVVLMASCLENIGVATAIVDVPGHLFLLVDLNRDLDDPFISAYERQFLVEYRDRFWLPVETTDVGRSFIDAWQNGYQQYQHFITEGTLGIYPTAEAWEAYPPTTLSGESCLIQPRAPLFLGEDLDRLRREKIKAVREAYYLNRKSPEISITQRLRWGIGLAESGLYDEAEAEFLAVISLDSTNTRAYSNLGVIYSLTGQMEKAKETLQKALELNQTDAEIWINLALVYYELHQWENARQAYRQAIALQPEFKTVYHFLEQP